jgi:hypothetical protein
MVISVAPSIARNLPYGGDPGWCSPDLPAGCVVRHYACLAGVALDLFSSVDASPGFGDYSVLLK